MNENVTRSQHTTAQEPTKPSSSTARSSTHNHRQSSRNINQRPPCSFKDADSDSDAPAHNHVDAPGPESKRESTGSQPLNSSNDNNTPGPLGADGLLLRQFEREGVLTPAECAKLWKTFALILAALAQLLTTDEVDIQVNQVREWTKDFIAQAQSRSYVEARKIYTIGAMSFRYILLHAQHFHHSKSENVGRTLQNYGMVLGLLGKSEAAVKHLSGALNVFHARPNPDPKVLSRIAQQLATHLSVTNIPGALDVISMETAAIMAIDEQSPYLVELKAVYDKLKALPSHETR